MNFHIKREFYEYLPGMFLELRFHPKYNGFVRSNKLCPLSELVGKKYLFNLRPPLITISCSRCHFFELSDNLYM